MRYIILIIISTAPVIMVYFDLRNRNKSICFLNELSLLFHRFENILNATPMELAYLFESAEKQGICTTFCRDIVQGLSDEFTFDQVWNKAIAAFVVDMRTAKDELVLLRYFSQEFGKGDLEDQKKLCHFYSLFCKEAVEKRKQCLEKNRRMYITLGTLSGVLIFILLC